MNSKFYVAVLCVLSVLAPAPLSVVLAAPSALERQIEQARKEREALLEEQRKLQAELSVINSQTASLGTAVKSLDTTRRKIANDINITQSKITSTGLNISVLEGTMTQKERQISVHQRAIATTILALNEADSRSLVLDLLTNKRVSDVWRDKVALAGLGGQLEHEIHNLRDTRMILEREKQLKEMNKQELQGLQNQLSGQKTVVEQSKSAQERLLAETKNKEAEYQRMLAENIAKQKEAEAEIFRIESELNVSLDPTLVPAPRPGILAWPLDNVFITQRFGKTSASGRLYASGTHNGVDFRAAMGTPVKAMLSGVVVGTGNTDDQRGCLSYGRWILIKHANGLSTIYAHLSASLIQKGQTVSTGQIIGYSGGTPGVNGSGYSTGPHVHVGLFASQGVEVRQFVTSNNCKQVFVPIADVKAYLDPLAYLPAL